MWPRRRHQLAVEKVQKEIEVATAAKKAAERRRDLARKLAAESGATTARLRREIAKNGWTELLQQAMGGRA